MAVNQVIHGSTEMLQIADAVAREKNIDRETVLDAMENAGRRRVPLRARADRCFDEGEQWRLKLFGQAPSVGSLNA